MSFYITKSNGEKELFNLKKFRRSLRKAGAKSKLIDIIVRDIQTLHPKSTQEIHTYATKILKKENPPVAARYNLKRALMEFGPAGFPFEKFVTKLLEKQGYTTEINQTIDGACVWYEIDIVAHKNNKHYVIECKFHNQPGLKSNLKVALYNKARFDDIHNAWKQNKHHGSQTDYHQAWIYCNTKFTTVAIKFAECVGMQLVDWSYPKGKSLATTIDNLGLHPITALTSLSSKQKRTFIQKGFVLCRDAPKYKNILKQLGFSDQKINRLIKEAQAVCELE